MPVRLGTTQVRSPIGTSSAPKTLRTSAGQYARINATAESVSDKDTLARHLNTIDANIANAVGGALNDPLLTGTTIAGFSPISATTVINHNLGRAVRGFVCLMAVGAQWTGYVHTDQNNVVGSVASGLLDPRRQIRFVTPTSGTFTLRFF